MANKYYWHSRISEGKFRQIIRCFAEEYNAAETAKETNLDRKSINKIFVRIRRRILEASLKDGLLFPFKDFGTTVPCFVAESEAKCEKYSTKYKSRVMVAVLENGLVRSEIIYAESEEIFERIERLIRITDKRIIDYGFYDVIGNLSRLSHWDKLMSRHEYYRNYPGNLLLYFLWRSKKFKGIFQKKFILHLRETEWRFNKISKNEKMKQQLETDINPFSLISKDMYDELLEILRTNPL